MPQFCSPSSSFLALPLLFLASSVCCPSYSLSQPTDGTGNDVDEPFPAVCPALPVFVFWLRRQCPAALKDTRCANGFPSDVPGLPGQLNCALASAQSKARLRQMSARELLALAKRRDPYGRPTCMLTLFYAPDCVFSAKVADTFFRLAPLLPKLRVVAVDVSVGGKGTESLISHYGISSTPVIALWQDGFPRYRLYDDYARLDTLLRVLRSHTDLSPLTPSSLDEEEGKNEKQPDDGGIGYRVGVEADDRALGGENHFSWEPTRDEFLAQFYYLREHLGFDWYLLAAVVTCLVNLVYFTLSSRKGRSLLRRHFPHYFAVFQ